MLRVVGRVYGFKATVENKSVGMECASCVLACLGGIGVLHRVSVFLLDWAIEMGRRQAAEQS